MTHFFFAIKKETKIQITSINYPCIKGVKYQPGISSNKPWVAGFCGTLYAATALSFFCEIGKHT
jgi:hypothetical protein